MSSLPVTVIVSASLLGAVLLGARLRPLLPERHLSSDSKDAVKLALGLVATMTALILGLLVSSAKETYDTARSEVMQMAAKLSYLDRMLALYGPEAADTRAQLHDAIAEAVRAMWPDEPNVPPRLTPDTQVGDALYVAVHRLKPNDDTHQDIKAQAVATMGEVAQLRILLVVQSAQTLSTPLLIAVVGWLVIIFLGFSVVAPPNATATLAMIAAALSVAGAIYLILELGQPFGGMIRIESEPMRRALGAMAK